ncbi:MAG: CoA activase [Spirochaetaceae bacterium]|nr:MAG: CoA activase [Spirochaetaceae bacterium]
MERTRILGLDVGSTSLSAVVLDESRTPLTQFTAPHRGNISAALAHAERELSVAGESSCLPCAVTGRSSGSVRADLVVDSRLATIRSVTLRYPDVRSILLVGGEQFSLIRFDADGRYHSIRTNTACAAGTGGFLDQQASRLCLEDSSELARTACANCDSVPLVATRCAVFAKTDLIHAQQEGYSAGAISAGLCRGLARNLVDTLFKDQEIEGPLFCTGGVSLNAAVVAELRELIGVPVLVDRFGAVQGAIGAALSLHDLIIAGEDGYAFGEPADSTPDRPALVERYQSSKPDRGRFAPPLSLTLSDYPDFRSWWRHEFAATSPTDGRRSTVEIDLYRAWPEMLDAYLGIDIGSTSTKAVVTDLTGEVYGGFYTRTAGRPLAATQAVLQAIDHAAERYGCSVAVHGSATTGSGRKFIGALINADEILDEISAHARAASRLDPAVDTIIEIGGQDAKFTTLRDGRVTSSVMNNVCAAGTGSFIEEQAMRLGVAVTEVAALTEGVRAPMVSDRCTVFMERDINHLLSTGHTVAEVLAAALHAVRENYLQKVAVERQIGDVVFFQGATAKNRSLVAAFEQRLGKPILVSPWCHLTGALGAALTLADTGVLSDRFAGLDLWRADIPVRSETCTLCTNHCKLTVADVRGARVAFGFLCGRDYDTASYVSRNRSGFDLLRERRRIDQEAAVSPPAQPDAIPVVAIPDALYLSDDLGYWKQFFRTLGVATRTSSRLRDPIKRGKPLSGAEFCAPITALHGHAQALAEEFLTGDESQVGRMLFLPVYLERPSEEAGDRRKFCYYSQFAASIVSQALVAHGVAPQRILSPLVASGYSGLRLAAELYRALSVLPGPRVGYRRILAAIDAAERFRRTRAEKLHSVYRRVHSGPEQVDVVLLGRPYTVLRPEMNKGIPELFAALGVKVFFQDMIEPDAAARAEIAPLLSEINWSYPARVLETAATAARTPGLYPVMISSFKCGPDSFITEYVKRIMEAHGKPYLILELDDHDSRVGYETRVEAALRAFRNHCESQRVGSAPRATDVSWNGINPRYLRAIAADRTLVLPNWDDAAIPLIATILQAHGYPAVVMRESDETIRRSLRWNNGQCIPMNALVEGFVETLRIEELDPEHAALWIPTGEFSCNIRLFPHHVQEILARYPGMERAAVYLGNMTFIDLSPMVTANAYLAYMFSGLIRRIACRIRPYEVEPGETDQVISESLVLLHNAFRDQGWSKERVAREIIERFDRIAVCRREPRPKVAIFGDVYVRDNRVMNQDIVRYIEANGGEVVTMAFQEFSRMTANVYFRRWVRDGKLGKLLSLKPLMSVMSTLERWYHRKFESLVGEPYADFAENPSGILERFDVRLDHEGESQDNLLKAWYLSRRYPDLSLFVQLSPMFCCAGLVTEAMSRRIEDVTGIPVLSITYDGTGGLKNDAILPYLKADRPYRHEWIPAENPSA